MWFNAPLVSPARDVSSTVYAVLRLMQPPEQWATVGNAVRVSVIDGGISVGDHSIGVDA